jgi:phospholipase C
MRFSRRQALQALSFAAGAVAFGCGNNGSDEEEASAAVATEELLRKYRKFVIVVMENRSFDHYFGHLSLPRGTVAEVKDDTGKVVGKRVVGEDRTEVRGFKRLADHKNSGVGLFIPQSHSIGDIDHEWDACHTQYNRGKNDGFVRAHEADLERLNDKDENTKGNCFGTTGDLFGEPLPCATREQPMAFYGREDTPVYHALADEYTLCDQWFSSVMGPTWPNRFYVYAGTSGGRRDNSSSHGDLLNSMAQNSIFGQVARRGCEFQKEFPGLKDQEHFCINFYTDAPCLLPMFPQVLALGNGVTCNRFLPNLFPGFDYARVFNEARPGSRERIAATRSAIGEKLFEKLEGFTKVRPTFQQLCHEGQLPPISIIEPPYQLGPGDDHPPHDIGAGQTFISSIYKMLRESPDWEHTLLLITYDEHGSFYDHEAPPQVSDEDPEFNQLGFRVPALVIGKGVRKKHVSHTRYEHCSVMSTLAYRFNLGLPNDRVARANHYGDCIAQGVEARSDGTLTLDKVKLSEAAVHRSIRISHGQKEVARDVFAGYVPLETKRVFTDQLLDTYDRLGVARIGT